ncbi:HAMP domain-containing sensor histidine kinase [Nocardioides sp. C4-1]|uniref:sensor histidine kinase n=1 Tax=Nocardioides sp. C4-1 TaxID=3151851 RepID=UPI0032654729
MAAVAALYLAELVALAIAVPGLVDDAPATRPRTGFAVAATTVGLTGAALMAFSGLLLLATRSVRASRATGRAGVHVPEDSWPCAVLVVLAAYVSVNPVSRLLEDNAPASTVGVWGRLLCLVLAAVVLLRCPRRPVLVVAVSLPALGAVLVVLGEVQSRLGRPLDAAPVWHVAAEVLLVAAWTGLALALGRREELRVGPWPAWGLAVVMGALHVFRALDGGSAAAFTLAGAALLLAVAGRVILATWHELSSTVGEVDADRWRLEDQLGEVRRLADHAHERQEEVAHDARNTCASLRVAVELLCVEDRLTHDDTDLLRRVLLDGVQQLEHLVRDTDEPSVPFDVVATVTPVVDGRRLRGSSIVLDVTGHQVRAVGRPNDLAVAVLNLLVNAERHAPGAAVRLAVAERGGEVVLRVQDAGPGIEEAVRARLFERGAVGPDPTGQGLGLHIARSLLRAQGGEVVLVPAPVGACFEVRLPAARASAWDVVPA